MVSSPNVFRFDESLLFGIIMGLRCARCEFRYYIYTTSFQTGMHHAHDRKLKSYHVIEDFHYVVYLFLRMVGTFDK